MEQNRQPFNEDSLAEVHAEALLRALPDAPDYGLLHEDVDRELLLAQEFYDLTPKVELYEHMDDLIELQGVESRMIMEVVGDTEEGMTVCRLIESTAPQAIHAVLLGSLSVYDGKEVDAIVAMQVIVEAAEDEDIVDVAPIKFEETETNIERSGVFARHEIARDSLLLYRKLFTKEEAILEVEKKVADGETILFLAVQVRAKNGGEEQFYIDLSKYFIQDVVRSRIVDDSIQLVQEAFGRQDASDWIITETTS